MDLSAIHFLEIGGHSQFKKTSSKQTTLFWTGRTGPKMLSSQDKQDSADRTPRDCCWQYEAPQCPAVPLGDGLSDAVVSALANKEQLKQIAIAGRAHVRAHHAGSKAQPVAPDLSRGPNDSSNRKDGRRSRRRGASDTSVIDASYNG